MLLLAQRSSNPPFSQIHELRLSDIEQDVFRRAKTLDRIRDRLAGILDCQVRSRSIKAVDQITLLQPCLNRLMQRITHDLFGLCPHVAADRQSNKPKNYGQDSNNHFDDNWCEGGEECVEHWFSFRG